MCGIVGAIALRNSTPIARETIASLTDALSHRGPDARGVAHGDTFSLGCRRLAVIDPDSRANQPLWDDTAQFVVAFNGEIYNFRELRSELSQYGARFRTESDTEVLLESFKRWGPDCLTRLDGIFAFGIMDVARRRLFLGRDRLGVKPLYYAAVEDLLVFGSEIKAVIGYPGIRRELAPEALIRFLRFRYVPFGDQYYRGVAKLPPGHALTADERGVVVRPYWTLDLDAEPVDAPPDAIAAHVERAVAGQLHADVSISVMLSGGIDSSILARCARDVVASGGAAFTAAVDGAAYDETAAAEEVARTLGLDHTVVPIAPLSTLEAARRLIRIKDQPLGMHNELALAELATAVASRSKVVLCGEGADEVFAGYPRVFQSELAFAKHRMWRGPAPIAARRTVVAGDAFWDFVLQRYFYVPDAELNALIRPEFSHLLEDHAFAGWLERYRPFRARDRFTQLTHFFISLHLPGLLEMVDAATMAASLEARVPYTDHRLVEIAFKLPKRRKLRWRSPIHRLAASVLPMHLWTERADVPKAVLRDAYRGRLPRTVFERRKMGFPTPLGRWLRANAEARDLVLGGGSPLHDYFQPDRLRAWYHADIDSEQDAFGRRLWMVANVGLFLGASR